jgi:hypothetical protein
MRCRLKKTPLGGPSSRYKASHVKRSTGESHD